jgi:DNA-binding transcriptional MerR regulator
MYSIGKVASETNLTVRTLRYYDEIHLLKPSHVAESGYRYYSKEDVLKLQRILAVNYPPLTTLAGCLKWGLLG